MESELIAIYVSTGSLIVIALSLMFLSCLTTGTLACCWKQWFSTKKKTHHHELKDNFISQGSKAVESHHSANSGLKGACFPLTCFLFNIIVIMFIISEVALAAFFYFYFKNSNPTFVASDNGGSSLIVFPVSVLGATLFLWIVGYACSLLEAYISPYGKFLKNIAPQEEVENDIERMKLSEPLVEFHLTCYRWQEYYDRVEDHTERFYDHPFLPQRTRLKKRRTQVVSKRVQQKIKISKFVDRSDSFGKVNSNIVGVKFQQSITPGDSETKQFLEEAKNKMIEKYNSEDKMYKFEEKITVPGFVEHRMMYQNKSSVLSYTWYLLSHLFCLGSVYRFWVDRVSSNMEFKIVKVFHCDEKSVGNYEENNEVFEQLEEESDDTNNNKIEFINTN
eukprot:gene4391-7766_t